MRSMCVGVAETGHRGWSLRADGMEREFFILVFGGTWVYVVGSNIVRPR